MASHSLPFLFLYFLFIYLFFWRRPSLVRYEPRTRTPTRKSDRIKENRIYIYIFFLNSIQRERERLTGDVVVFGGDAETDVVGQDGHHVDDGHDAAHKLAPVRSSE